MNTSTSLGKLSSQRIHAGRQPFYQRAGQWFVNSNDQSEIGPFCNKAEAQLALAYYVHEAHWPNAKQLRSYQR